MTAQEYEATLVRALIVVARHTLDHAQRYLEQGDEKLAKLAIERTLREVNIVVLHLETALGAERGM